MAEDAEQGKKHLVTWDQLVEFAKASGREVTHTFRVFKGERLSPPLEAEFEKHFGFAMKDAEFAGRRRSTNAA